MGMLIRRHRAGAESADAGAPDKGAPAEGYAALSDDELAEAYATNVGGNATSRKGQAKALDKLDAEAATFPEPNADPEGDTPEDQPPAE